MPGESDSAAHRHPVCEDHDRLRILRDGRVERILLAEERPGTLGVARHDALGQTPHVTPGAQPAISRALEQDALDIRLVPPRLERIAQAAHHPQVERVESLGALQHEATDAAGEAG